MMLRAEYTNSIHSLLRHNYDRDACMARAGATGQVGQVLT